MLIPTDRKQPCENIQHYRSIDIVPITIPYVFPSSKIQNEIWRTEESGITIL